MEFFSFDVAKRPKPSFVFCSLELFPQSFFRQGDISHQHERYPQSALAQAPERFKEAFVIFMRPEVAGENRIPWREPEFLFCLVYYLRQGSSRKKLRTGSGIHHLDSAPAVTVSAREILLREFRKCKNEVRRADCSTERDITPQSLVWFKEMRVGQMPQVGNTGCDLEGASFVVNIKDVGVRVNDPIGANALDDLRSLTAQVVFS